MLCACALQKIIFMRVKKKDYNEYLILDNGIWVRNFILSEAPPTDQNASLMSHNDMQICLENETQNYKMRLPPIGTEDVYYENVVIVSDGTNLVEKKASLMAFPKEVCIIAVNGALNRWTVDKKSRPITYYVVNNPYVECMNFLPKQSKYYPPCIASVRTRNAFLKHYIDNRGIVFVYTPVSNKFYSGLNHGISRYVIDDYRNPICAAISLAYRFKAKKILLFCHDECFADDRPGSILAENNLWTYPQQKISNELIDAHLKWIKGASINVGYHADGLKLNNATYIPLDEVPQFFTKEIK
jgi:hypothetical protein